jgi:hypothetical protein
MVRGRNNSLRRSSSNRKRIETEKGVVGNLSSRVSSQPEPLFKPSSHPGDNYLLEGLWR